MEGPWEGEHQSERSHLAEMVMESSRTGLGVSAQGLSVLRTHGGVLLSLGTILLEMLDTADWL